MHNKMKASVGKEVLAAKKMSFTTDTWMESNMTKAFIGLSAHWIDGDWNRKFAVLNCEQFSGRHTGELLGVYWQSVFSEMM